MSRRGGDLADVVDRQLAGEDDALDAELADELDAARLGERHLRRAVHVQRRRHRLDQPREAEVLHDDRVDARRRRSRGCTRRRRAARRRRSAC